MLVWLRQQAVLAPNLVKNKNLCGRKESQGIAVVFVLVFGSFGVGGTRNSWKRLDRYFRRESSFAVWFHYGRRCQQFLGICFFLGDIYLSEAAIA